jgi:thiamine-monophosphate kinase
LSDGLSLDLNRMCLASRVAADIASPPSYKWASPNQALHGGEDYELLFTFPPRLQVPSQFEGLPLTRIGRMRRGRPGFVRLGGTRLLPLGFDHFQNK